MMTAYTTDDHNRRANGEIHFPFVGGTAAVQASDDRRSDAGGETQCGPLRQLSPRGAPDSDGCCRRASAGCGAIRITAKVNGERGGVRPFEVFGSFRASTASRAKFNGLAL